MGRSDIVVVVIDAVDEDGDEEDDDDAKISLSTATVRLIGRENALVHVDVDARVVGEMAVLLVAVDDDGRSKNPRSNVKRAKIRHEDKRKEMNPFGHEQHRRKRKDLSLQCEENEIFDSRREQRLTCFLSSLLIEIGSSTTDRDDRSEISGDHSSSFPLH